MELTKKEYFFVAVLTTLVVCFVIAVTIRLITIS